MADGALSRDAFLAHVGRLAEELVDVPAMGKVLVRELSGRARAEVLQLLAPAASGGKADIGAYQKMLLENGLIDPESPKDERRPLLDVTNRDKVMELGASKVEALCKAIERLSGLDAKAAESAEKNSGNETTSASTSE